MTEPWRYAMGFFGCGLAARIAQDMKGVTPAAAQDGALWAGVLGIVVAAVLNAIPDRS